MKRFLFVLAALCSFAGCSGDEQDESPERPYLGSIVLTDDNGAFAGICSGVSVVVERSGDTGTLTLYGVKFDAAMPPSDLMLCPVRCENADGMLLLSADEVPLRTLDGIVLDDRYLVSEMRGELYNGELTLTFRIGALRAGYRGYRISDR